MLQVNSQILGLTKHNFHFQRPKMVAFFQGEWTAVEAGALVECRGLVSSEEKKQFLLQTSCLFVVYLTSVVYLLNFKSLWWWLIFMVCDLEVSSWISVSHLPSWLWRNLSQCSAEHQHIEDHLSSLEWKPVFINGVMPCLALKVCLLSEDRPGSICLPEHTGDSGFWVLSHHCHEVGHVLQPC